MTEAGADGRGGEKQCPRKDCRVCGKGELNPRLRTERFDYEYDGEKFAVVAEDLPVSVCDACGEVLSGPAAAAIETAAIARAVGLLSAAEIRTFRERLGMPLEVFARRTGIRRDELSEWERGRALQPRSIDLYLRLLIARPDSLQFLEELQAKNAAAALPRNGSPGEHTPAAVKAD